MEELQQLHFNEQPGGLQNTSNRTTADPSTTDDVVWQYIAQGGYRAKSSTREGPPSRIRAGGDKHSSHSDEELIDSLTNRYFKPVKCSEEEDSGPDQSCVPERPVRKPAKPAYVQDKRGAPSVSYTHLTLPTTPYV